MKAAVTVGTTLYIDINPDDYDTKEEMLKAAEEYAMLNLDQIDRYFVLESAFV